jgi:putative drug exporter of the RND superfamily
VLIMLARLASAAPRLIIGAALLAMAGLAIVGAPVTQSLSPGGLQDPNTESTIATQYIADVFSQGYRPLMLLVQTAQGIRSPHAQQVLEEIDAQLRGSPNVATVSLPLGNRSETNSLISRDGKSALVIAGINGGERPSIAYANDIAKRVTGSKIAGITVAAGGTAAMYGQITDQARQDVITSEVVAIPIIFVVLVWAFGGVVAALIPLLVGGFAILGSMAALRLLAQVTDVSIFALNLCVALGMALAIDYSLLITSRYKEERANVPDRHLAIRTTMATAGRTVAFSAVIVALSLATMAVYPRNFLRSFAYSGIAVVVLAALAACLLAPAAIIVAEKWLEAGSIHTYFLKQRANAQASPRDSLWYRWTLLITRRPLATTIIVTSVLVLCGLPFLDIRFGSPDDRVLPASSTARQVGDQIRQEFDQNPLSSIPVIVRGGGAVSDNEIHVYSSALSAVDGVLTVSGPAGSFRNGKLIGPAPGTITKVGNISLVSVTTDRVLLSPESGAMLDKLHSVGKPAGSETFFGGIEQGVRDNVRDIVEKLPIVILLIAIVMFVLLLILTKSIVLPVKAIILSVLSLSATFGVLVWVFQEGHLGGLATAASGTFPADIPVLMFFLAFGLSMDYEVFLISRIREYWLASDQSDKANLHAVACGLAGTGRIVTAAALIMSISFIALGLSSVSFMRIFGVGLTLAVLLDATVIRVILLPALMAILGRWNWWAPHRANLEIINSVKSRLSSH